MALTSLDVGDVPTPVWPDKSPPAPLDSETLASGDTRVAEGRGLTCIEATQVARFPSQMSRESSFFSAVRDEVTGVADTAPWDDPARFPGPAMS